jgi:hypothetical protein
MKTHPSYNSETTKHLETLNYFIKDIQENGSKNIKSKFAVFLSKPSIASLSKFGCQYNDFMDGVGEMDNMLPRLLKAQMGLIDVCLQRNIEPKLNWFKKYHYREYKNELTSRGTSHYLLESNELVKWLKDENKTPEKTKWLEFLPKEELDVALKKEKIKDAVDFFPKSVPAVEALSVPKKNMF